MVKWLILAYVIISAIVLGVNGRHAPRKWLIRWILVCALPVFGWLLPVFWPRWLLKRSGKQAEDIFEQQDDVHIQPIGIYQKADPQQETDLVPLEEALAISDVFTRRKAMIDVLKQDSRKYLDILQKAAGNEDSETSHYAVSAIIELKRKLMLSMQELSVQYEENKDDPHLLRAYADVLRDYMRSGYLDEHTLENYKAIYILVLGHLIRVSPELEEAYREKAEAELEVGRFSESEQTARLFLEHHPRSEDAYLLLMKIYFTMKSHEKLQETLNLLKKSPLRLSNRAVTLLRFWTEGT